MCINARNFDAKLTQSGAKNSLLRGFKRGLGAEKPPKGELDEGLHELRIQLAGRLEPAPVRGWPKCKEEESTISHHGLPFRGGGGWAGLYRLRKNSPRAVILSEAKNLGSCVFNELRRSFVVRRLTDSSG